MEAHTHVQQAVCTHAQLFHLEEQLALEQTSQPSVCLLPILNEIQFTNKPFILILSNTHTLTYSTRIPSTARAEPNRVTDKGMSGKNEAIHGTTTYQYVKTQLYKCCLVRMPHISLMAIRADPNTCTCDSSLFTCILGV